MTIKLPIKQKNNANFEKFMQATEWILSNQNSKGGWSVPVQRFHFFFKYEMCFYRSIGNNRLLLNAGWHSAMAQGHAISVLVRANYLNKRNVYIKSIQKALHLFSMVFIFFKLIYLILLIFTECK